MSRPAIVVLGLALLPACSLLPDIDFERMVVQERFQVWQAAPYFEDGRAMRPVPEDTVPRDSLVGAPAIREGAVDGLFVERVPLPVTRGLLVAGRARYDIYCAACHGVRGDGDSPIAASMTLRPPPSLVGPVARGMSAGRLYQVTLYGYGLMRSYREDLISPEERWSVVAYLRALQDSRGGVPLDALPPSVRDDAQKELR